MKRYQSIGELPLGEERRVVAIGTFDGVHLGHQAIIGRAIERARERGLQSMVLTFEPNPLAVLKPELAPTVLTEAWVNSNYGEILRRQLTLAAGSKDSALVLTLEPGAYTCRVAGAGTSTGVALVEVYLLP